MYPAAQSSDPYLSLRSLFLTACAGWLGHNLDFPVSHITRPFHSWRAFLLRCFGARLWSPLSFLSQVAGMGSVESVCRRWSHPWVTMRRFITLPCLYGIARHRFPTGLICGPRMTTTTGVPPHLFSMSLGAYSWVCAPPLSLRE